MKSEVKWFGQIIKYLWSWQNIQSFYYDKDLFCKIVHTVLRPVGQLICTVVQPISKIGAH